MALPRSGTAIGLRLVLVLVAVAGGLLIAGGWLAVGWAQQKHDPRELPAPFARLVRLHRPMAEPRPGDWVTQHPEPGQTYREYLAARPVRPTAERNVIYVQPLGEFDQTQRKIVDLTARFLGAYFQLPVKMRPAMSLHVIPQRARRVHPSWGDKQILTGFVLDELLRPRMPRDACALIALTTSDLWPGEGWNFVFGQASLRERVGVWSIYRNGDPGQDEAAFRLCLLRTLKTSSHELGHMFSMRHCIYHECNMCGSNHRAEADRRPLALCPVCLAKLCHATGADPEKRFGDLIAFCKAAGLEAEQQFYERSLAALSKEDAPAAEP